MPETDSTSPRTGRPSAPGASDPGRASSGFRVFRNRNFRLLWTGLVVSNVGSWMQSVAQGWLVVTLTHDPGWLGAVSLVSALPFLFLPLFGGVIADRIDRIRLLKFAQAAAMLLAALLAVLTFTGVVSVWHILLLAFLTSVANSFDQPTRNALVPDLVDETELMQAVSLSGSAYQGAALLGPSLAGLLVGLIGVGGCFLINAISYLAVIGALFMMRVPPMPPRPRQPIAQDLIEGARFLRGAPVIVSVLVLTAIANIFGRSYSTLLPAFARLVLHTSSANLGLMYTMPGIGTIVGGLALAAYGNVRHKGALMAAMAILGAVALIILAGLSSIPLLLITLLILGLTNTAFNATTATVMQMRSPAGMRGRVMSYNTIASRGLAQVGGFLIGVLASLIGTRAAIASGGAVVVVASIALYLALPYIRQANETAIRAPIATR